MVRERLRKHMSHCQRNGNNDSRGSTRDMCTTMDRLKKVMKKGPPHSERQHIPVVRTNHETGRKCLYVNRLMTDSIVGLDDSESQEILDYLFDHCEQDQFVYKHEWTVGDLIIWDNRCSMHARTDFPGGERRLLFRTTVKDTQAPA